MKKIILGALLLASSSQLNAAVVYSQPTSPGGALLQSSWMDPNGSDYDQYVWDNFTLGSTQMISEIDWSGGYIHNRYLGDWTHDFTVSIYASIPAGTQPDLGYLYTGPLVSYTVGGNANESLAGTVGGTAMYDYQFTLPTPFQADAGTKYWVQIEAAQYGIPDWGIAAGSGGDGNYFRQIANVGDIYYQSVPGDAAFALNTTAVPLPAPLGLLSLGLFQLFGWRRRTRH